MSLNPKTRNIIYYVALVVVLCIGFFGIGPLIDNAVIVPMMPYLIIDESMVDQAMESCDTCGGRAVQPIELVSTGGSGTANLANEVKLPVTKVPQEYLPYVHYPDNWNKWYNLFNPTNGIAVMLSKILFAVCVLGAVGIVIYFIYLYQKKKFKFQRKIEDED